MCKSFVVLMLAPVVLAVAVAAPIPPAYRDLPRGWDPTEIEAAALPGAEPGGVYVLAWLVREDGRPLRVESCLVLKELDEAGPSGRWCLTHLYRHPQDPGPAWRTSSVARVRPGMPDAIALHTRWFRERPGPADIDAALPDVRWEFEDDFTLVGSGVCERNWSDATGEGPPRGFADRQARPRVAVPKELR